MKRVNPHLLFHPIAALALILSFNGCTSEGEALENANAGTDATAVDALVPAPPSERVPVEVAALERGSIEAVLRFSTNLEAETAVQVFSEASRQVVALEVEEGDAVTKGQVLLRLEDEQQKSALAKAQIQFRNADREYQRQKRLFEQELISEKAFNDATFEVEQLKIAVEDAERELSYTEVRAPIDGIITERMVSRGDTVTVNQHLFDLVDFDSIVARVFVPEREMPRLRVGQAARVKAPALGGDGRIGHVLRIAPVVDSRSGTTKTTIAIPRNAGLRPGMFVEVELITSRHENALLVPKRAIVYENDQAFVFRVAEVQDESGRTLNKAERLLIRPRLEDRAFVEPEPGALAPGDRVVSAGQAGLKDGAPVRLLDAPTLGDPALPAESPGAAEPAPASEATA